MAVTRGLVKPMKHGEVCYSFLDKEINTFIQHGCIQLIKSDRNVFNLIKRFLIFSNCLPQVLLFCLTASLYMFFFRYVGQLIGSQSWKTPALVISFI